MRRLALALAVLCAACASPRPCTQALCPTRYASYRVNGWNRAVTVAAGTPAVPIVSDSSVDVLGGPAEFVNGRTLLTAADGTTFVFAVSTGAVASVTLSSGAMTVSIDSAAATALSPGAPFLLPVAK